MAEARVLSFHHVNGQFIDKEKDFMNTEDALDYAKKLDCMSVRVLEKDKGVIYYERPLKEERISE